MEHTWESVYSDDEEDMVIDDDTPTQKDGDHKSEMLGLIRAALEI